jgi:peptidoglycan hydrolase-like protein with peptidoglycan-binding domain
VAFFIAPNSQREKTMEIKLSQPFAPNSAAAPFDVLQVKKGLNRLGYYTPLATTGITDIPDTAIFSALKKFQKDFGLAVTGIINPDDATIRLLNLEISKTPKGQYI